MSTHPDDGGVPGTIYIIHLDPPYKHAGHYLGWTAENVQARLATHLAGRGSPLIRAAVAAGARVQLADSFPGSRFGERRLKRWHKTGQFCPICRQRRGGRAR
jgi:predicted GIY-YIG superfamily endonuclease